MDPRVQRRIVFGAAAALVLVEFGLLARDHVLVGQIVDGVLLLCFLNAAWWIAERRGMATVAPTAGALRALALVALIPVVAAGLPLGRYSQTTAALVVAASIAVAAVGVAPSVDVRLRTLFTPHRPGIQAAAAGAGAALGLVAYLADADPRFEGSTASVVAALVAVAIVEEVVYRGVVQQTLEHAVGRRGVLVATALFVSSYAGSGSTVLLLVLALAGLAFAVSVSSSGSLGGAVVGHAALALGVTVVWPELLDDAHRGVLPATPTAVALGLAIAAGVRFALRRRAGDPVAPAPSGG